MYLKKTESRINNTFLWKTGLFMTIAILVLSSCISAKPKVQIAIQPLGNVRSQILTVIKLGIEKVYDAKVVLLHKRNLPKAAYYKPRWRYRADILLDKLEAWTDKKYTKVVGITEVDISATKGNIYDWGIFGLGQINGRPCVISTFRLKRGMKNTKHFYNRLVKVVNHEIGHTFGLWHCPVKGCLMQDARGTIRTVDSESGDFCKACKIKLKDILKQN